MKCREHGAESVCHSCPGVTSTDGVGFPHPSQTGGRRPVQRCPKCRHFVARDRWVHDIAGAVFGCLDCAERRKRPRGLAPTDLEAIGARGRARRLALGLSRAELARRLGYTVQRVYSLEGAGAGMVSTVMRWASALEMDPAELAFGPPAPKGPPAARSGGATAAARHR